jgi:hypothetical protein
MLPEEVTAQPVKFSTQAKRTNIGSFTLSGFIINSHCSCPEKYMFFGEQIEHRQSANNAAYRENGLFLQDVEKAAPVKAQPLVSRE